MDQPAVGSTGWDAWAIRGAGFVAVSILVAACFGKALFAGDQFAYRDSGHYYYPLYWSVQEQWRAGSVPLWQPGENGGMPLLGNPTAAVLYPGKLIYAALPYAWAARVYIVAHVLLALAGLRAMLRSWGIGPSGSTLGGMAYAFGAPVLFLYCNVIYLVGAAWAPLGFLAADRWLRRGWRWGLVELAVVLAMQALGGDLEAAYLTALCSAGYAAGLAIRRRSPWAWGVGVAAVVVGWAALAVALGSSLALARSGPARLAIAAAWAVALAVPLARGLRGRDQSPLGARLLGLGGSGVLALALGAAQLLPVAENLAASGRWRDSGQAEEFSLEPYRAAEWAWPNLFGSILVGERSWVWVLPSVGRHRIWVPSIYFGALPLALALGAAGFRGGPPWRAWLTAVALLGFLAACGKFVDPPAWLGLGAGGSPYRLMTAALPGFAGFRYPGKLVVFVALAMAGLAGIGWDRLVEGRGGRSRACASALLVASLLTLAAVGSTRGAIVGAFERSGLGGSRSVFGPFDAPGVWTDLLWHLGHASVAWVLALVVIGQARARPAWAGAAAVLVLALDLSVANAGLVLSLPQSDFDRPGQAGRVLEAAGKSNASGGRPRVFRLSDWTPKPWESRGSAARAAELIRWELDTLGPMYGLLQGIDVFSDVSSVEHEDFEDFFRPYLARIDARMAEGLGVEPGSSVLAYPRRALDLWGVRDFLLPVDPGDWKESNRALATLLDRTERVETPPGLEDFQVRRNLAALPRAWIVHDLVALDPEARPERAELVRLAAEHLARGPSSKPIPRSLAFDPRESALIETRTPEALDPYRTAPGPPGPSERPRIVDDRPSRVELAVTLERPGLVVLADRFDPGWKVTVDGKPGVVLKANSLMRAVAVDAGTRRIVYEYDPPSFRVGSAISLVALVALGAVGFWARKGDARPTSE